MSGSRDAARLRRAAGVLLAAGMLVLVRGTPWASAVVEPGSGGPGPSTSATTTVEATGAVRPTGVGATGAGPTGVGATGAGTASSSRVGTRDVIANLFEWNWISVARECSTVLGPKGYGGVQVAPPQDSLSRTATDTTSVLHPWWEVYQPVRYALTSRMGDEHQFEAMVATCRQAGVKVYVDAVVNNMTGQGSVSYGGAHYRKYDYPGLYGYDDFHHTPADCPTASGNVEDFNNYGQVTKCELLSLSDLRTESPQVRDTLVAYLNRLVADGVSGFRIDAAKHIGVPDLLAIEQRLDRTADGTRPSVALEVSFGGPGKLAPLAYSAAGTPLGFDAAQQLRDAFKSYTTPPGGSIADLAVFGQASGLLPSARSLAFVADHDTERNGSTLTYKDGASWVLAHEFLLASGYGTPQVYAGFTFTTADDSPPSNDAGFVTDTDCSAGWFCTDRLTGVANMVGWHNLVAGGAQADWWDDGTNAIAFSRGGKGWIALNHESSAISRSFATGLPQGVYCDVIHGDLGRRGCSGPTVTVDAQGAADVTVPANDAVAIDVGALLRRD
ncbi:MAG TPA: alpha-amylase family protein [Kineosporiaceae bacterium]|nr:alpha-amylase family protein [Kineosporiaceae bacterium]